MRRNKLPQFYGFGYTPTLSQDGGGGTSQGNMTVLMPGTTMSAAGGPVRISLPPAPTPATIGVSQVQLPTNGGVIFNPPKLPPLELPPSNGGTTVLPPTTSPPLVQCPAPYSKVWAADASQCPVMPPPPVQPDPMPPVQRLPPGPISIQGDPGATPGTIVTTTPPPMPAGYWAQFQSFAFAQKLMIAAVLVAGIGVGAVLVAHRKHA